MKHTHAQHLLTTFPITIGTPYGDLHLSYRLTPCDDCGGFHGQVSYLESPGLARPEALDFIEGLPDLLLAAGRVADLALSTEILFLNSAARRA